MGFHFHTDPARPHNLAIGVRAVFETVIQTFFQFSGLTERLAHIEQLPTLVECHSILDTKRNERFGGATKNSINK